MFGKGLLAMASLLLAMAQLTALGASDSPREQLRIDKLVVYKYQGYQPYDVVAHVVDGSGATVKDAEVSVLYASLNKIPLELKNQGNGYYVGCDLEVVDAPSGTLSVMVQAVRKDLKSDIVTAHDQRGNYCGAGEPQISNLKIVAAKPDGEKQPLDIQVEVFDETGAPVAEALVYARVTDYQHFVDSPLKDMGNGKYGVCEFGTFTSKGAGALGIHVRASAPGLRPNENDATNEVGRLCDLVPPSQDTDNDTIGFAR